MKLKRLIILFLVLTSAFFVYKFAKRYNFNSKYEVGQPIDSLNGVIVYYNGGVDHAEGRNVSPDNYNLGQKYQCVEFIKRYYYQHLNHKMPDALGHAKDFFDKDVPDGQMNEKRGLLQYCNGGECRPEVDDLIILKGTLFNRYGHVAIISAVTDEEIEVIQQNPGPFGKSRERFGLKRDGATWTVDNDRVMGWLRKEK